MRFLRGTPLHLIFFLVGILLPTLVLSVFSFRSIRNEVLLAEKNYEEEQASFRKVLQETVRKETQQVLLEVQRKSQYLFDRPQNIDEFGKPFPLDQVHGVSAVFLYSGNEPVYPSLRLESRTSEWSMQQASPQDKRQFKMESQNSVPALPQQQALSSHLLGQLRYQYRIRNYAAAMRTLDQLENIPDAQGYLLGTLTESIWLMRFNILVESGQHNEAEAYCLDLLARFLKGRVSTDLVQTRFTFETMFNTILSFERLAPDARERFWNLRRNLNSQLEHARILSEHQSFFQRTLFDPSAMVGSGMEFQQDNEQWFFLLSHPWLPANQLVIGQLDTEAFNQRLLGQILAVAREWKQIRYSVSNSSDSLIAGASPGPDAQVVARIALANQYPQWSLSLYQKDNSEIRRESRNKMILLYTLVGFSLLVILLGTIFVFQGIAQERKLLAMKANFLSSVSHELKTPLTSIKMFSEMIAGGRVQKAEKIMEYSGLIGKEATRLENLIGAILSYTRMEHGTTAFKWECIDLATLASKVFDSVDGLGRARGLDMLSHWEDDCWVMGDYTSLYSLVQNLTDNAIKYTPPPGSVEVSVRREKDSVIFAVSDSGVGIPASEQKNIFNDFYRVGDEMTRSTKGSGLGLAIVKRVAEAHRAVIQVQSRPGKGSTFTVRFKRAENATQNISG